MLESPPFHKQKKYINAESIKKGMTGNNQDWIIQEKNNMTQKCFFSVLALALNADNA